jgi:tetratricopeptide (TPR) repeat protein
MSIATTLGEFDKAKSLFNVFQKCILPSRKIYQPGGAEYWLAVLRFYQGKLAATDLVNAEQAASQGGNLSAKHGLAALRAEWELTRSNPAAALDASEHALSLVRRTGAPASVYLGLRAHALALLGHTAEAREALAEAEEIWSRQTPRFPLFAAQAWLALGDHAQARALALQAYSLAWADGPPYIHHYYLNRCRELLARLGEPEPQLPPFDPAKVEPIPFEAEIRAVIKKLKAKRSKARKHRGGMTR